MQNQSFERLAKATSQIRTLSRDRDKTAEYNLITSFSRKIGNEGIVEFVLDGEIRALNRVARDNGE